MLSSNRSAKINVKVLSILLVIVAAIGVSLFAARHVRRRLLLRMDLNAGQTAYDKKDWPAAYRHFQEYLGRNPDDLEILKKYAEARMHIRPLDAGAIGGAIAAAAGTDFLCYVTPSEHLALPGAEDVKQGVIASRIAAHAGDIVKGVKGAAEWDKKMSVARKSLDWEEQARLSLDPERSRRVHGSLTSTSQACSMCGEFCAMELMEKYLGVKAAKC